MGGAYSADGASATAKSHCKQIGLSVTVSDGYISHVGEIKISHWKTVISFNMDFTVQQILPFQMRLLLSLSILCLNEQGKVRK